MKKQRWRWTKTRYFCRECGGQLDYFDKYQRMYGLCSETCALHIVGMSWTDFYTTLNIDGTLN
jgi:hypothetical protein